MKQNRARYAAILAGLLAVSTILGACRGEDIPKPPQTTAAPAATAAPTTTAGADSTTAPESPLELAPVGTVQAEVAPGYTMRALNLPGNWTEAEWIDLDAAYALIRTTEFPLDGGRKQDLHLLDRASGRIVDAIRLSADEAMPEINYSIGSSPDKDMLILYALEQEGDAFSVVRSAVLRWQGGKLVLDREDNTSPAARPASWSLADPVGRTQISTTLGRIHFSATAQLRDGIWSTPHKNEICIETKIPARYAPLAYLDRSRVLFAAIGTGSPAEHDHYLIHVRQGQVTAIPALDGMQIVGVHGDAIHAIDPTESPTVLYAYNTLGQRVVRYAAADDSECIRDVGDGVLIETARDGGRAYAFALYSPDMTARLANFTLDEGPRNFSSCFVADKAIYLVGHSLPAIEQKLTAFVPETPETLPDVEPIAAEVASGSVLARTIPGEWESCSVLRYNDHVLLFVTQGEGESGACLRFYDLLGNGQFSVPYDLTASALPYRYLERCADGTALLYAKDGQTVTAAVMVNHAARSVTPYDPTQIIPRPDETAADIALYADGCALDLSADAKTVTVRSPDKTTDRIVATLPATAKLYCALWREDRLCLFGRAMSDVAMTQVEFAAQTPIAVRVNAESSFALRTVEVPGHWEQIVTHPLDAGHTLIEAYYRESVGHFVISLHLLDNATGRITASHTFETTDELPYLARIGEDLYLYNLRNARGEDARAEEAVRLIWSPTELRTVNANASAVPPVFSTITAPNGVYTVGATTDYGIVRFTVDHAEKRLLTPDREIGYYEPIGFLDNTRLLYLYRNRIGVQRDRYATIDVATGEIVTLPQLDGMAVSEVIGGIVYAEEERINEGDFAYWAISETGWKTLLYTVPVAEKFTRTLWTEGRFRIESEFDPAAQSNTYTVYNRDFVRIEAEYDLPASCRATRLAMQTSNSIYFIGRDLPPVVTEQATYAPRPVADAERIEPLAPAADPTISLETAAGFTVRTISLPDAKTSDRRHVFSLGDRFTLFHTYDPTQTAELKTQTLHLFDRETGRLIASRSFTASRILDRIQVKDGHAILYSAVSGNGEYPFPMVARQVEFGPATLNILPFSAMQVEHDYLTLPSPDGKYTVHSTFKYTLTATTADGNTHHLLTCPYDAAWNTAYYIPVTFVDNTRLLYTTLHGEFALIDVATCAKLSFPDLAGMTFAGYRDGVIYATSVLGDETIYWAKPLAEDVREIGRSRGETLRFVDGYWLGASDGVLSVLNSALDPIHLATVILSGLPADRYTVIGGEDALYLVGIALPATPEGPTMVTHTHSASGTIRDGQRYDARGYRLDWSMPYGWFFTEQGSMSGSAVTDNDLFEGELTLGLDADAWLAKMAERGCVPAFADQTAAGIPYRVVRHPGELSGQVRFDLGESYAYTLGFNVYATEDAFAETLRTVLATFTFTLDPVPTPTWQILFPDETGALRFTYYDDLGNRDLYAFVRSDTDFAIRYHDLDDNTVGEYTVNFGRYAPDRVIPIGLYARADVNRLELYLELHQEGLVLPVAAVTTGTTFGGAGVMHPDYLDLMQAYGARFYPTEGGIPTSPGADVRLRYTYEDHGSSLDWIEYDDRPYTVTLTAGIRWGGAYGARYAADPEWGPVSNLGKMYHGFSFDSLEAMPKAELGGVTASGIPYTVYETRGGGEYDIYFSLPEGYTYHMKLDHRLPQGGKSDYETYTRPILNSVDITLGEPTFPFHVATFPEDAPYYRFAMRTHRNGLPLRTYYFFDGYDDPRKLKVGCIEESGARELELRIPATYRYDEAIFLCAYSGAFYHGERGRFYLALRDGEDWHILRFSDDPLNRNSTGEGDYAYETEETDNFLWNNLRTLSANGIAIDALPWTGTLKVGLPALSSPAAYDPADVARRLDEQLPYGEVTHHARVFASDTYLYFVTAKHEPTLVILYAHTPGAQTMTRIPLDLPEGCDSIRPIYVGGGGGSGECRILLAATRDGETTVLQYDNFAFTIGENWLDFTARGEVDRAELLNMLLYEGEAFVGFTAADLPLPESGLMPPFVLDNRYLLYATEWPSVPTAGMRPIQHFYLVEAATGRVAAIAESNTDLALDRITAIGTAVYLWTVDPTSDDPQAAQAIHRVTWRTDSLTIERAENVTLPGVNIDTPAGVAVVRGYRMRGTHTTLWLCRANEGVHLYAETAGKISRVDLALPADISYNESSFALLYDDAKPGEVTLLLSLRDGEFDGYTYRFFVYPNAAPGSTAFSAPREINMDERNQLLEHSPGVITG